MSDPRIDSLRNQIDRTNAALQRLRPMLDDLHVLAYDRQAARMAERVNGGDRSYALDTNGDMIAREHLRTLKSILSAACADIEQACFNTLAHMDQGHITPTTTRAANADDVKAALEAQQRRTARGEYTPSRGYPQPEPGT